MIYVDITGKNIKVGDVVIYAASHCDSSVLKYGIIKELNERKDTFSDKIVPVIKVLSVYKSYRNNKWTIQANGKIVILNFMDRLIVVDKERVPADLLALLHGDKNE